MRLNRFVIALVIAGISLLSYFGYREYNPVTGETQHVSLSAQQEIALGLRAAPELAAQFGGPAADRDGQARVEAIGKRLISRTAAKDTPYKYQFHLLGDEKTVNAFALPGGQVFITSALLKKLRSEGELAAVLAHEIGHVVARHGAEHLAKAQLTQGLAGAAVIAASDPNNPGSTQQTAAIAAAIGQLVNMRFGRDDELESDRLGVKFTAEAGYDPRAMISLMETLSAAAGGQTRPPEFFSTHPNPDRRIEKIKAAIDQQFPQGVPAGLQK